MKLQCTVRARLHSRGRNSWRLAQPDDSPEDVQDRSVHLEIQGSEKHGYHLVMSPEGLFTADYHYPTQADALEDARELFGVEPTIWQEVEDL